MGEGKGASRGVRVDGDPERRRRESAVDGPGPGSARCGGGTVEVLVGDTGVDEGEGTGSAVKKLRGLIEFVRFLRSARLGRRGMAGKVRVKV